MTREYVMLPDIKRNCDDFHRSSGFGYLPLSNEYKVVELYNLEEDINSTKVVVYTLGSGSGWINVGRFGINSLRTSQKYGVFLKGALHWMHISDRKVFVFDLVEEKFHEHGLPLSHPFPVSTMCNSSIGVLGGLLYYYLGYLCPIIRCIYSDIWILKGNDDICYMEEQVEQEPLGWLKEFCIPGKRPFALTKSGCVLCFTYNSLSIYDAISSTSKELVDSLNFYRIIPHNNTLVSLK
ncbi:uncharacterized protein LOC113303761 [Papaver somniferum]|uniref:uncharacterized protein LOC113303761 n=1 Tax=Papaver somniferum TaxID=3469 RepID=UPI000E6F472B|nr:uncharacterized protein LOC113303761 [Papaver somniferum]